MLMDKTSKECTEKGPKECTEKGPKECQGFLTNQTLILLNIYIYYHTSILILENHIDFKNYFHSMLDLDVMLR